ncbi:MAG TPA: TrmH family RNA methyltransferase, partial [Chloroflexota bacterium]|nr:TrmH family RNA methyltransferase [Chloroflexota bacterium]
YVADAGAQTCHWDVDWLAPAALIVSSEAHGPSAAARGLATQAIAIPMARGVESLNAAIAGSIILYEALRQRTHRTDRTSAGGSR